jgi:hypothetical protein
MALNPNILTTDVDALSPIDEYLMTSVRSNLERLDTSISGGALSPVIQFKLNGPLDMLPNGKARRVDAAYIASEQSFSNCKLYLDEPGTGGTLEVDLRKITTPNIPIIGITPQFTAATQTIARAGAALSTQSITRTTAQIATQSVTQFKESLNVLSIVGLGSNLWQVNLSAAPDSDWVVGDTVTIASATSAGNNGSFQIVRVNDYASQSVIVTNASGVEQVSPAGTCTLRAYSYNFVNPVGTEFVSGENATFATHSTAGNNGSLRIYAVNLGGNNIVVKNPSGATQGTVAGTVDVLRFSYNLAVGAIAADYVVGDTLLAASHTNAANNGNFRITAVNNGGNNLQVYNPSGVIQGGVAGNINSNQWVYTFSFDYSADVSVSDAVFFSSHTNAANNGQFVVRQLNRSSLNNICIFNQSGVAQAAAAGTVVHTRKLVRFASDQSSKFEVGKSWIEIQGTPSAFYNTPQSWDLGHQVLEINRGGGANYNVVISVEGQAPAQNVLAGWVSLETRSIFAVTPKISVSPDAFRTLGQGQALQKTTDAEFIEGFTIASGERLAFYILSVPTGADSLVLQVR